MADGYIDPNVFAAQRRSSVFDALLQRSMQPQDIRSPLQGLAGMGNTILSAYLANKGWGDVQQAQTAANQRRTDKLKAAAGSTSPVIDALMGDPATMDVGVDVLEKQLGQQPEKPQIAGSAETGYFQVSPNGGAPTQIIPPKTPDWKDPGFQKFQMDKAAAGRSSVNVDVKGPVAGSEAAWKNTADAWKDNVAAVQQANRNKTLYDAADQALQGFRTGATAPMRLKALQIAKDLGFKTEGVPEGELIKGISSRLQSAGVVKGQGQVSNYERDLFAAAQPNLSTSVEGNQALLGMARKLDDFDRRVEAIYRASATKNGGAPNPVEVSQGIEALGPALDQGELNLLQQNQAAAAAPAAAAPPAPPAPAGLPALPDGFKVIE